MLFSQTFVSLLGQESGRSTRAEGYVAGLNRAKRLSGRRPPRGLCDTVPDCEGHIRPVRGAGHGPGRLALSRGGQAGKTGDPPDQAAGQPTRPCAGLFPGRRRGEQRDRRTTGRCGALHGAGQPGRSRHQRLGRARARQHRGTGGKAGHGRQSRPLQEIRRYRRVRHRDRRERSGRAGRHGPAARAGLRRHQSGRHQGARLLPGREPAEGGDEHPRLPRRPARHRHRRRRRRRQRHASSGKGTEPGQAGLDRRRRSRHRLPEPASGPRSEARECLAGRHRRARPQGAQCGAAQGRLRPGHLRANPGRRDRRRRDLSSAFPGRRC